LEDREVAHFVETVDSIRHSKADFVFRVCPKRSKQKEVRVWQ